MMTTVAEDGKQRDMLCLPLKLIPGWLFGIDSNRVKPEIRDRVIAYQRHCYDVLYAHFFQHAPAVNANRPQFAPEIMKIDDVLAYLSDHQLRVLGILRAKADVHTGQVKATIHEIGIDAGISPAHTHRILCLLYALNIIETHQKDGFWLRHTLVQREIAA